MQFLKTLFWALLAATAALFAWVNWNPVTVNLWSDLVWSTKLSFLLLIVFVLGWLPTWLIMRARIWTFKRRFEALERQNVPPIANANPSDVETPAT